MGRLKGYFHLKLLMHKKCNSQQGNCSEKDGRSFVDLWGDNDYLEGIFRSRPAMTTLAHIPGGLWRVLSLWLHSEPEWNAFPCQPHLGPTTLVKALFKIRCL